MLECICRISVQKHPKNPIRSPFSAVATSYVLRYLCNVSPAAEPLVEVHTVWQLAHNWLCRNTYVKRIMKLYALLQTVRLWCVGGVAHVKQDLAKLRQISTYRRYYLALYVNITETSQRFFLLCGRQKRACHPVCLHKKNECYKFIAE